VAMGLRLVMQSAVASAPSKCYREENAIGLSLCLAGDVPAPTSLQQRPVAPMPRRRTSPWRTWSVLLAADASVAPSELWVHGISWCLNCVDQQNRTTSTTPADHNARPNTAGPGITERPIDGGDKAGLCLQTVPDNPN